ncbi:hypothetical protein P8625_09365 [Tenacibaculum tangerinum]|uniref:Cytochrome c domain-containing protein n=1 Tax=Tenacibaculum tangerinum TaxID=3038772 RepID=A0ABY8L2V3_9FLAO|nr:hypothetical protein [Tenacibaculum tangerinum]WGH74324.1 hypothetical protein P8625_09365 [Tenacibaculum tangerinum]
MKTNLLFVLSISIFVSLASCSSDDDATPTDPVDPDPTPVTKTTYDKDVKTAINNSCATSNCHDATAPTGGLPLTNYTQVKNAAQNGNLITRINSNTNPMPPTGKDQSIINLINNWKNDGYLEN